MYTTVHSVLVVCMNRTEGSRIQPVFNNTQNQKKKNICMYFYIPFIVQQSRINLPTLSLLSTNLRSVDSFVVAKTNNSSIRS
jgi:hypothetical protein